jgi:hypothetical protein
MLRRLLPVLVALLAIGAFAMAGCGGDDDDEGDTTALETTTEDTTTDETTTEDTTSDETTTDDSAGGGSAASPTAEQCTELAQSAPGLSSEAKAEVEELCGEIDDGDIEQAREAAQQVCEVIVTDTIPEGAARDQALDACEAAATAAP